MKNRPPDETIGTAATELYDLLRIAVDATRSAPWRPGDSLESLLAPAVVAIAAEAGKAVQPHADLVRRQIAAELNAHAAECGNLAQASLGEVPAARRSQVLRGGSPVHQQRGGELMRTSEYYAQGIYSFFVNYGLDAVERHHSTTEVAESEPISATARTEDDWDFDDDYVLESCQCLATAHPPCSYCEHEEN